MSSPHALNVSLALLRGTWWSYLTRFGSKPIALVSTIFLVRLLTHDEFGVAMYALAIVGMLAPLGDLGIGTAVIYHRDDAEVAHTAFWLCLGAGLLLAVIVWLAAPLLGQLFFAPHAVATTQVLALLFPLTALGQVHESIFQKRLAFRSQLLPSIIKASAKGGVAVSLALAGFGFWSMIWGQLVATLLWALTYWWLLDWRPQVRFSLPYARTLLSYSKRVVPVNLLGALLLNVDFVIVGHLLGPALLGIYTVGFRVPELLIIQLGHVLNKVLFPIYRRINDDRSALGQAFIEILGQTLLLIAPLSIGLAVAAEPIVRTLLTDRWFGAVPVVQAIALYALFLSVEFQASSVLKAQGRLGLLFRLTLLRGALILPALWWAASSPATLAAVAWSYTAIALLSSLLYLTVAARTLDLGWRAVMRALAPPLSCGTLMGGAIAVGLARFPDSSPLLSCALAALVAGSSYLAATWLLQRATLLHLWQTLGAARARGQ